jgi:hypothetical protein
MRVFTCVTAAGAIFLGFGGLRDWISGYLLFDTRSPWDCSKSDGLSSHWDTHLDVGCLLSLVRPGLWSRLASVILDSRRQMSFAV